VRRRRLDELGEARGDDDVRLTGHDAADLTKRGRVLSRPTGDAS
jgi:hypothetical protein